MLSTKKKSISQRGLGSFVPAHLNDTPFFTDSIPDSDGKVKNKLSRQSVADPSELTDVQFGIIGDITLKAKNTDKLPIDYMVSMWGGSIMTCAMETVSLYLII